MGFTRIKRWVFDFIKRLIEEHDLCGICGDDVGDYLCVGCDRRICGACDSRYYNDAELCTECRKNITPEEEEMDRRESAEDLAEQCTCRTGGRPCDLSDEEHKFMRKYAPVEGK